MQRHWKGFLLLFVVTLVVAGAAIVFEYPVVAYAAIVAGLVGAFVFGIAWMRPKGYPKEHHPRIDRVVNDTQS